MNQARRDALAEIVERIAELYHLVDEHMGDEEDAHANLPENLQNSEQGEAIERAIEQLSDAASSLDDAQHSIQAAIDGE